MIEVFLTGLMVLACSSPDATGDFETCSSSEDLRVLFLADRDHEPLLSWQGGVVPLEGAQVELIWRDSEGQRLEGSIERYRASGDWSPSSVRMPSTSSELRDLRWVPKIAHLRNASSGRSSLKSSCLENGPKSPECPSIGTTMNAMVGRLETCQLASRYRETSEGLRYDEPVALTFPGSEGIHEHGSRAVAESVVLRQPAGAASLEIRVTTASGSESVFVQESCEGATNGTCTTQRSLLLSNLPRPRVDHEHASTGVDHMERLYALLDNPPEGLPFADAGFRGEPVTSTCGETLRSLLSTRNLQQTSLSGYTKASYNNRPWNQALCPFVDLAGE